MPARDVVARVRRLVEGGIPEVVLTGVDVTSWGQDLPDKPSFGRLVRTVLRGTTKGGAGSVLWNRTDNNGRRATAGVYFCRLAVGDRVETRRLIVVE